MSLLWSALLLGFAATAVAQQPEAPTSSSTKVMLAAVSHDEYVFTGNIIPGTWTQGGTVAVEPLAYLTPLGEWSAQPCSIGAEETSTGEKNCREFARTYLSKPHLYTVIGSDGTGAVVRAAPTTLTECFFYRGAGTYSGADIQKSAIAASSPEFFAESVPLHPLGREESVPARKALNAYVPAKLDTTEEMQLFSLRLEGHDMLVVQRTFADAAEKSDAGRHKFIFAIGTLDRGGFHFLHWNEDTDDEQEGVLATIALKNGRQFLITAVSEPESQYFRVYGIRSGRLTLIYTGGGSSC